MTLREEETLRRKSTSVNEKATWQVRLRRCTCVHCTGYGVSAVYSSSLVSCSFLCMGRCGESRWRKAFTSQPLGRENRSRTHHTVYRPHDALVQRRSRALRPYTSRILWARVVRACHSLLTRHPPFESPNGDSTSEQVVKGMPRLSLRTGDSTSEQVV